MHVIVELWQQAGILLWVVPIAAGLVAAGIALDRADRG
jgi:hypothetical protein